MNRLASQDWLPCSSQRRLLDSSSAESIHALSFRVCLFVICYFRASIGEGNGWEWFEGHIAFGYIHGLVAILGLRRGAWIIKRAEMRMLVCWDEGGQNSGRGLKKKEKPVLRLACSGTRPGSGAGHCVFWLNVELPGRGSWADVVVSGAARCLDPGLELGRFGLGRSSVPRVPAWPPRVGGVGGGFGGIGVLMPFWRCSRGWGLPLRRRRGCPIALSRDAARAHERQAGMWLNDERWHYNGMLLAPMRDACAVSERRLLSATATGTKDRRWAGKLSRMGRLNTSWAGEAPP
jgi:hypothetical protein